MTSKFLSPTKRKNKFYFYYAMIFQKIYEHVWFPLFENFFKGRKTASIYFDSLQSQWLTQNQILANQGALFCKLLKHAKKCCPYYADILSGISIENSDKDIMMNLQEFPILTKDIVRRNFSDLISSDNATNIWNKRTGGSTGQPLHFAYTKESYEWRVAMSRRGYTWAGALPGSRQAHVWGVQLNQIRWLEKFKESLHHFVDRQLYFNCFEFDNHVMAKCLAGLNRFKPNAIIGYTNPLYNFALFIGDNSKLKFSPQGIICAAEKVHLYQREIIEQIFGAKVFNTYGSREFMLIAAECEKHEGLHVSAENLIVEIIKEDGTPAKDGETGRIVITDLHNFGMPFIRYEIGDLGIATTRTCSCGRGLPLIADIIGRTLDVIRTPEGKIVPGEFFPHLMKDFHDVARFQVIQEKLDYLVIKIVPTASLSVETKEQLEREVRKIVGPAMVINYETVSEIPLTTTGKYRVTISKVNGVQDG